MDNEYIRGLKEAYNACLLRHVKASMYLDNNSIPLHEREQWIPNYQGVLQSLNELLTKLESEEIKYSVDEAWNGFYIEDNRKVC